MPPHAPQRRRCPPSPRSPFGQVSEARAAGELVESTTFGADDLPFEVRRGDGTLVRRMTYDASGLPLTFENGTGQTLTLHDDTNAQLDALELPDFQGAPDVVDVVMDGRGQLLEVTRSYPTGLGTTSYGYDAAGRMASLIRPSGAVTRTLYNGPVPPFVGVAAP